jgi:hypothetical protein
MVRLFSAAVVLALIASVALTTEDQAKGPITEIAADKNDQIKTKDGSAKKPTHVTTAEELEKLVPDETTRKRWAKEVDFKTHTLLVFGWQGSGKDKLNYEILESAPEQIRFTYQAGLTDDIRRHVRVYVLRKDVKWSVK